MVRLSDCLNMTIYVGPDPISVTIRDISRTVEGF